MTGTASPEPPSARPGGDDGPGARHGGADAAAMPDRPAAPTAQSDPVLYVRLATWEGPLDLLLALARARRVDLKTIPILPLVDQYLAFIEQARRLRLELKADHLVMAAWLAYLKSALLLPNRPADAPDAEAMAARLRWRLERLAAMREAARALAARPLLGRDVFLRGKPEGLRRVRDVRLEASLFDLLSAYGALARRRRPAWQPPRRAVMMSVEEAIERLTRLLGHGPGWHELAALVPPTEDPFRKATGLAAGIAAALELARLGRAELRQDAPFAPLWLRARA
ncbi:MAG: segregation/condensation protein A [Sphingomonadaceae bacterium]|uniref:segregation and condensation protein A n=1 Tax=Thermaurantiacus sp. TaxID=2820283 RepID=UPI00298F1F66|nr:ScpA family protein [Thermaurantiacus sp.]MCS6987116.1 segregation/condensation protein A [Sphingomonadaceae bacterium]MDW8415546.1 ScpA family protein [Thermaurantiacus sp.]